MDAFIFARGGSKTLPNKNLMKLNGVSLITRTINQAMRLNTFSKIIVSTDDSAISFESKKAGALVPFIRPANLATDSSPEIESWKHAINYYRNNLGELKDFVVLPVTCPLRSDEDIMGPIAYFKKSEYDLVITGNIARKNPYFNMVEINAEGNAQRVIKTFDFHRRQDAPDVYEIGMSAFVADPDYILSTNYLLSGKVGVYEIPVERATDIDTLLDFQIAEMQIKKIEGEYRE